MSSNEQTDHQKPIKCALEVKASVSNMPDQAENKMQFRPYKYKLEVVTSAKGQAQPHVEVNSDDVEEAKKEFDLLWSYVQEKTKKTEPVTMEIP